ncbi:MAG: phosphoribosylaminoimidazolesuccinocarboxamide synthase [Aeromonadales bacterium]|jgi:phosphoribosylaminoimidazole-succinocarboxamide synthase|nr:phosphoribosylaminoimidazolesuccinocarboxamide synthase [Aeromonadales bacterium]MDY2891874.1 phosphoribosylaminoimidazolesuccinocarboxamide synthase [Succinivibrio sp.]
MEKKQELYRGKAKSVFATDDPNYYIMLYRDDTSAFDGKIIKQLEDKGRTNNHFNFFIMKKLEEAGIPTHTVKLLSDTECLVKKLKMLPVECVVRNVAAGSICRRLGVKEGLELKQPTFEFFYKDDELHDPMVNDSHILAFGWGTQEEIDTMKSLSFKINDVLKALFDKAGLILVDYKLEFGKDVDGNIILGDEFSPDGCRLWDKETRKKLDKDRFRQNLGGVIEGYKEVARRIGCPL